MAHGNGNGKVTLADVAARARVDRSVVSRVLNDDPRLNIRPETRARVVAAIDELGYRPNAIARSLRTRRSEALGLLIPDFSNPIYATVITGAEAAAARNGLVLLMGSLSGTQAGAGRYAELADEGRVDGLLLAGTDPTGDLVARLEGAGVPWLLVNRRAPGARRCVLLDDERAAAMAVEHLVALGHRRIAHITGPEASDTGARRRAGYLRAMADAGLEAPAALTAASDYTYASGAEAMRRLLAADPRPTAIFVANVAAAIGALAAARGAGVAVPGEVSVLAVHDLPLAEYLEPPLTTVRMPLRELGERAVELLLRTPPAEPVDEIVDGDIDLVVRGSTGPAPSPSPGRRRRSGPGR